MVPDDPTITAAPARKPDRTAHTSGGPVNTSTRTPATDENGCYTLPNGECVSEGPCLHTPASIRYIPLHPSSCSNPKGRHMHGDFSAWFATLTETQQRWLRDKARWEHVSLSAVAREWGVPADV